MNEQNKTLNLLWEENRELKIDKENLIKFSKSLIEENNKLKGGKKW